MLQLLRSKIRLNFVGPSQVPIRVQYSTRFRSWISESRISDTITNTAGVRGGEAPPRTGTGGPNSVEAHHPLFNCNDNSPDSEPSFNITYLSNVVFLASYKVVQHQPWSSSKACNQVYIPSTSIEVDSRLLTLSRLSRDFF